MKSNLIFSFPFFFLTPWSYFFAPSLTFAWWHDKNEIMPSPQTTELTTTTDDLIYHNGNHTLISATAPTSTYVKCPWTCELTNDAGYVVYSALGSFYIPMLVMLFFYWRIYRAAVRTTKAINQGFRTTKGRLRQDRKDFLLFLPRYYPCSCNHNLSQSWDSETLCRLYSLL